MSIADRAAHVAARGPVRVTEPPQPPRTILERFPASHPRGSWPAEEYAAEQRRDGVLARVVMDLSTDSFLVVVEGGEEQ